jgi:tetratricopeptide (TPR) repeat protein
MKKRFEGFVTDGREMETFSLSIPSDEELARRDAEFRQFSQRAISKYPEYKGAVELRCRGAFNEAIEIQKKILSNDPTFFPALYELGFVFRDLNDFAKAIECFKEAEKYCDHRTVLMVLSLERASAEKNLADSLFSTNPVLALSHYAIAEDLYRANLKEGRLPVHEYALSLVNYGNLCFRTGRKSRAHDIYSYALSIIEENQDDPRLKKHEASVRKFLSDTMN